MNSPYYLLVYTIKDYQENGGGTKFEKFKEESKMHERVNELSNIHKEIFHINVSGWIHHEFEYTPVKQVVEYKPERKKPNS